MPVQNTDMSRSSCLYRQQCGIMQSFLGRIIVSPIPRGPRKFRIFICHRYRDHDLYDRLRRTLRSVRNFKYQNLSVQDDMLFEPPH